MSIFLGTSQTEFSAINMFERPDRGPCPRGFHIPSRTEFTYLRNALGTLQNSPSTYTDLLWMPPCYYLNRNTGQKNTSYGTHSYWLNNMTSNTAAGSFRINENNEVNLTTDKPANGANIRAFKDTPEIPDDSWTLTYSDANCKIYHNAILGLLSITADNLTWFTIQDKNVGATAVYNPGDTVTDANAGCFYQFGNNYGFPYSGPTSFYTSVRNTTGYGPENPYYDSKWTKVSSSNWFSNTNNSIWGYEYGDIKKTVTEVWLGNNKVRPTMRLVLQGHGGNIYEENGEYIFTDEMGGSVDIIMKVPTSFNTIPTGYHTGYAEEYWFLNQWCQKYGVSWTDFLDLYNIDWGNFGGIITDSYTVSSGQCSPLGTYDGIQFYMRGSWMAGVPSNNYLSFADSNYTNYYKIARPSTYIDASINPGGVYWTPFYAKNNVIRVLGFSCTSQPYRCEAAIIFTPFDRIMMNYAVRPEALMQSGGVIATGSNNMAFLTSFYLRDGAIGGNYYQGQIMNYEFGFNMEWHSQSNMWYFPNYEITATDAQSMNPVTVDIGIAYGYNNQFGPVFSNPFIWLPNGYSENESYRGLVQIL